MSWFMGTHRARLDRKGRISVPAGFRAALGKLASPEIILRPSHRAACIDVWPRPVLEEAEAPLARLDLFGETSEALAAALYADATPLSADIEGRIMLSEALIDHAGLAREAEVAFIGLGRTFQMWEPAAGAAWLAAARERARAMTVPRA